MWGNICVLFAVASTLLGQYGPSTSPTPAPAAFEAAAIKSSTETDPQHRSMGMGTGGYFHAENQPLHALIEWAYNLKDFEVLGGPSWIASDDFNIRTTPQGDVSVAAVRTMLQALLKERFKLAFHFDSRQVTVYELVVAPKGLKLPVTRDGSCATPEDRNPRQPTPPGEPRVHYCSNINTTPGTITGYGVFLPQFVGALSSVVGRTVIDKTDLPGKFDFQLSFAPTDSISDSGASSIFTAIQDQLGLKLESAKAPVRVLMIDSVEKPSAN